MNTLTKKIGIALLSVAAVFYGCQKETIVPAGQNDPQLRTENPEDVSVNPRPKENMWKIFDFNGDRGRTFDGYNFTFHKNGLLDAYNGSRKVVGRWYKNDTRSLGHIKILFNEAPQPFNDLNGDWQIIVQDRYGLYLTIPHEGKKLVFKQFLVF